jgi:hypothetical protein
MHDRQLAIYDFGTQPASLGDFLTFLQGSLAWSVHCGVTEVDLCVVCNPAGVQIPEFAHLASVEGGLRAKVIEFLPMAQMHPGIRSMFIVDHLDRAYEMLLRADAAYHSSWPPLDVLRSGTYLWYPTLQFLDRLHGGRPVTPRLRARAPMAQWALDFLVRHAAGRTPVTINLRMNLAHGVERNMNTDVWRAFFDDAARNHDATFFLLGAATENFDAFRSSPNVVVTKDWHTSMEEDLALIEHGKIHLGSSSGPATFAIFLDEKPALSVNCAALPYIEAYRGALKWDGQFLRFGFGNPNYALTAVPETVDFLTQAFRPLLRAVQASGTVVAVES